MSTSKPSSFTESVRDVVRKIPRGSTLSYKEVAAKAGNPNAARAVARIMSQNYDLTVPCHRVIRTDGGLGGYNEVRKCGTLSQEVVDIFEKISYNLHSPCKGELEKLKLLVSEGVILRI